MDVDNRRSTFKYFGAWRNRGGEVVYSVNDFDEAVIYDFHLDILHIAVSICNHATNGFHTDQIKEAYNGKTQQSTMNHKYSKYKGSSGGGGGGVGGNRNGCGGIK